jgi:hypothetical protein
MKTMDSTRGSIEGRLDSLFQEYRDACPAPMPSANFMPELWQKIEARQNLTFSFGRMAGAFVTAALALSIGLGIYMATPRHSASPFFSQSYVEALDATDDSPDLEPVRFEVR